MRIKKLIGLLFVSVFAPAITFADSLGGNGGIYLGSFFDTMNNGGGNVGFNNVTLNGSNDLYGACFHMDQADTITQICYRYGVRTGTPPTYRASLQAASTSGLGPTGTVLGGGSPASVTFTPPASASEDGTVQCKTLTNSYAAARGERICGIIDYSSGTINGSNNGSFTANLNNVTIRTWYPIGVNNLDGGGWARSGSPPFMPMLMLKSSTKVYGYLFQSLYGSINFDSGSTPDEYGSAFTLPAGMCDTFKVSGMRCMVASAGVAAKTTTFTLYNGTSALASEVIDTDEYGGSGAAGNVSLEFFFDTDAGTLNCGTEYIVAIKPGGGTEFFGVYGATVATAAELGQFPLGTAFYAKDRTDSGAWTNRTSSRLFCEPKISDMTEPSAGGGNATKLNGGLN